MDADCKELQSCVPCASKIRKENASSLPSCLTTLKTGDGANSAKVKRENLVSKQWTRVKFPLLKNVDNETDVSTVRPPSECSNEGLTLETVASLPWGSLTWKHGIVQVDKTLTTTAKWLRRCRFECWQFVVTFRVDYEDDVSSVSHSSSLSDEITKISFRALALPSFSD